MYCVSTIHSKLRSYGSVPGRKTAKRSTKTFRTTLQQGVEVYKIAKNAHISLLILAAPSSNEHITLDTKAYNVQVGRVLLQVLNKISTGPVEYW